MKKNATIIIVSILSAIGITLICLAIKLSGMSLLGTSAARTAETTTVAETVAAETEPENETEPEPTEEPVPESQTFTLTVAGDCALGKEHSQKTKGSFKSYYEKKGSDYFLTNVKSVFGQDDLTLVNLECAFTTETKRADKKYTIKGDPSYVSILTGASVEAAGLGNSHSADYGDAGLTETEKTLDSAGIIWALDEEVAYFTNEQGVTAAIISRDMSKITNEKKTAFINTVTACEADEKVDLIFTMCQWGSSGEHTPTKDMQGLAHKLIEAGADGVFGVGPNVLQGIEYYENKMICYSLGSLCVGDQLKPDDYKSMIYQQTFTFNHGSLEADVDAKIIPVRISSNDKKNNFQPVIATAEQKAKIITKVNDWSSKLGYLKTVKIGADGAVTLKDK